MRLSSVAWATAAFLVAGLGLAESREKTPLKDFVAQVARRGVDSTLEPATANFLGLTPREAPLRAIWIEGKESPGGRRRGFAIAYNSPKGKIEPAAILLFSTTRQAKTKHGARVEGKVFLARLSGELVRVTETVRTQKKDGGYVQEDQPVPNDASNLRAFRKELRFWLEEFDLAAWRPR